MEHHTQLTIDEVSQVGGARRQAVRMAEAAQLDSITAGNIAIIVTELATNLVRYAQRGRLFLRCSPAEGFEAISVDHGPGMDVQRCLQDGFSTGGSPGTGLGAVRRLAQEFDAYSLADKGSVIVARAYPRLAANAMSAERIQCAAISLPAPGESECGDAWAMMTSDDNFRVVVSDGLGHGHEAAVVSLQVLKQFRQPTINWHPKSFLEQTHQALSGTRGAAVAAGVIDHDSSQFTFAGVGNVSATIISHQSSKGLMSHNGTLGCRIRTVQPLAYDWPPESLLVMHSDGLMSRWSETEYPGILTRHCAILAATLIRDFCRGRDDVTVAVVRRK